MNFDKCNWETISVVRNPYIGTLKKFTEDTILFDGYFYVEAEVLPVERILRTPSGSYHVEIQTKTVLEDTSVYDDAEDEDMPGIKVCYFPSAIIEMKYRVLAVIVGEEQRMAIRERIKELEVDVRRRELMLDN